MLENFINKLLRAWVAAAERFPLVTLIVIGLLTVLASKYTAEHFSINSDLDRLIKPTKIIDWYQDDREYRDTFPQYQQKALVVVSGVSAEKTYITAEAVYRALQASKKFADVFAPTFDEFANSHALYGAPTEGVRYIADNVQSNLPGLSRIYQNPTIPNFLNHMESTFIESADLEVLTPESKHQFEILTNALIALNQGKSPSLNMVKKLMPQDDGKISYQFISVKDFQDFSQEMPYKIAMDKIHAVIKTVDVDADVQVRVTGEVALANDDLTEGMDGVQISGAISTILTLIILMIGIGYGRHSLILNGGMFLMLFVGIVWTTFFALLAVGSFSSLSVIFLVMFFGLGVEYAIHYTLCAEHHIYNSENTDFSPTVAAAGDVGIPLMLSALSAVIGFLSFLPTAYVGLAELGKVSAIGMSIAFIMTFTFLPAWYKVTGVTSGKMQPRRLTGIGERFGHFFSSQLSFAPKTVMFVITLLAMGSLWYAKDLRFNYSHLAMRNKASEAIVTLSEIQKHDVSTDYSISVITEHDTDLQAFKETLLKLPSVAKVELPGDQIPLFQDVKYQYMQPIAQQLTALGDEGSSQPLDKEAARIAMEQFLKTIHDKKTVFLDEDLELVNQLDAALSKTLAQPQHWSLLQDVIASGIYADINMLKSWFMSKPFGLQDLPESIKAWFMAKDGRLLVKVIPALDMSDIVQMDQFIAEVDSVAPHIAGRTVIEWGVGNMVIDAFKQAATITFVAIFILLWLNFRHITTVILVFLPLIITTIFMFAIMKMIGLTLNMANILVVPMIFGLGVDMGIHVVDRYHKCHNVEDMVVSYTTRSIILGGMTTVSAFVALSFSPHKGAASIGILLSISMMLLLLVTYIVLPALLAIFQAKKFELVH